MSEFSAVNLVKESPLIAGGILVASAGIAVSKKSTARSVAGFFIVVILILMLWFYRHPAGTVLVDSADNADSASIYDIYSPAYGTIYNILPEEKEISAIEYGLPYPQTPGGEKLKINYTHISIFLSPADVHVQYIPTNAEFVKTTYDASGKFNLAYDMNKSSENEKAITAIIPRISQESVIPPMFITQIAGFLVRRINTNKFNKGEKLKTGQELGMIKFGSRVDIEIPTDYYDLVDGLKKGDYLYGSRSKIATPKARNNAIS